MSSILEAFRKEHAARGGGGMFADPATIGSTQVHAERSFSEYLPAADCVPRASTLGGVAASMLLGASLGVGVVRLMRGDFPLPFAGAEQTRETYVALVAMPPVPAASAALPIELTDTASVARVVPDRVAPGSVTPAPPPVLVSTAAVARPSPHTIAPVAIAAPSRKSVVLDGGVSVGVRDGQYVTVMGEATSVRSLVAEICRQAGIDLRTYSAPDRRYSGRLQGERLADAFRRILRSESYVVGVRLDPDSGQTRMAWLRVVGSQVGRGTQPAVVQAEAVLAGSAVASPKQILPP